MRAVEPVGECSAPFSSEEVSVPTWTATCGWGSEAPVAVSEEEDQEVYAEVYARPALQNTATSWQAEPESSEIGTVRSEDESSRRWAYL